MEPQNQIPQMPVRASRNKKFVIAISVVVVLVVIIFLLAQSKSVQKIVKHSFGTNEGKGLLDSRNNKVGDEIENSDAEVVENNEDDNNTSTTSTSSVAGSLTQSEEYTVTTKKDIVYGTASGMNLKIDIYTPVEVNSPTPAVLYIHGGGFHGGNKNGVAAHSLMIAKH